jgi:hypothetical protein
MRQTTRDHQIIKQWADQRGGQPARVRGSQVLRLGFGKLPPNWEPLPWEEFFKTFEQTAMSFWYDDGPGSRLFKLTKDRTYSPIGFTQ